MKKLIEKVAAFQEGKALTREQMKTVTGGGIGPIPICFRCCPDDPCSNFRHVCPEISCGEM
ncbi:hypothetical protein SAMN05421821_102520 [Mucilaginibacter lappiensis]|uniref:Bacteriocin-type signal sequence-containing protein n=1 Tax=Mucilaginibacter lappiensis TaxID=354630 RepID=A0ABR6PEQ8_9SPHI|nr:hypothetical protein [Mucilaginibacter lappiensis]MBB6108244.1 hypothetical protein [Mucilaginibacter lappiensis]SIQ45890.1 hypothetical protein SAMN05421821_102520 [Mucilaginibacter lappiensis]